jgi:hypothetical protein
MTRYTKSMREAMEEVWANDITLDEGKMKTIATMFADGKSAKQIAKKMKLPVATVKTILGEEDIQEAMLWEFSDGQIAKLKKDYASLKGAKISLARANQLRNIFDKITNSQLPKLYKADIPFLSAMALSRMIKKGIQVPKGVRLSAFREQTWEQILIDEKIQQGFAVRYSLDGKRLVQAYKTQKDAEHRAKILKSMGGVKDVSITQHSLNFKEEDFNIVNELGATTLKEYAEYIEYMAKNSSQAKAIANMFKGKTGGGESKSDGSEVRIDSAIDVESIHKQVVAKYGDDVRVLTKEQDESAFNIAGVETSSERTIEEKIQPYMISYSQYGKHYGFEGGDSLSDIQNIAQKLRKKGFTIDKMGRYNPPLDAKLRTGKTGIESDMTPADIERLKKQGLQAEAYTVQITKTDGSKLVIGKYKTPAEAEKYISWYKTGDMSKTKSVKVIKEASNTIYKVKKDGKVVFTGKYNQVLTYRKQHGGEIVTEEVKKEEDKEVSNAPKKKFGDIKKEITDKNKDSSKGDVETLRQQLGVLRQKLEIEKHKAVKPQPNKDTGEVPLTIGLAHKLLRDKDKTKEGVGEKNEEVIGEATYKYEIKISSDSGADGPDKEDEGTLQASSQQDAENKAEKKAVQFANMWNKRKSPGNFSPENIDVYKEDIIRRSFKSLKEKIDIWGIGQQQPAKVRKAMDVARRMSGNYSGAVKEIEKIAKDLSKLPIVKKALLHANEEKKITERGGANTSSKQGSFARSRKPKYRFGYRVAEKEPKGDKELEEIRIRPKNAIGETDLTKSQVKKVHHKADELPKKSFRDKYGKKKGDSIRYAVATNQTKKKLGIENKNHPAKKKWETLTTKKTNKDDSNKDILPNYQEPTQKTDPMNIQTKEPEKKRTDNGTKSDKIDVNPRIDYHA